MKRTNTCIAGLAVVITSGVAGCDCGGDEGANATSAAATSSSGAGGGGVGGAGVGGAGGSGGQGTGGDDGTLTEAKAVVTISAPLDATLSNDGTVVYFTAFGTNGAAVYSVPVSGGNPIELAAGDPLVAPFGIALDTSGKKLFIADLGVAGSEALGTDGGKIFSLDIEGGTPTEVQSSDDTVPRGLDVVERDGTDVIYYTGRDATGAPALFELPATGGEPTVVAKGPPFVAPAGVAATADAVYVLDPIASSRGLASIIEVKGGVATELVPHLAVGWPAGIALSHDGSALLVSGYDPERGTSAILRVDLVSEEITTFPKDDTFAGFDEPGGLHRARNADVYAFVEAAANGGTVFVLE